MRVPHTLKVLAAALLLGGAVPAFLPGGAVPALAAEAPDRAATEQIIHDYLIQHPEVIEEAITQLQAKQQAEQAAQASKAVVQNADKIYRAPQNVVLGNPNGDVTLVEFFDYNCGYCKHNLPELMRLVKEDGKLKLVLKDFPILSAGSVEAAIVARGVEHQLSGQKMLDFHAELLGTHGPVGQDRALQVAREAGVDMKKLQADMSAPSVKAELGQTRELGDTIGISGTPTFVIGDEMVVGATDYDGLKSRIDSMRRCGHTSCG